MTPTCEMDYIDADTKKTVICIAGQNGQTPNPGKSRVAGKWACKECLAAIKAEIKKRTGVGGLNAWQAIKRSNL